MSDTTPARPPDLRRIVEALDAHGVQYVLIGGAAALMHGTTRATVDTDILARGGVENLSALADVLEDLGGRPPTWHIPIEADHLAHYNTRWETAAGRVDVLLKAKWSDDQRVGYPEIAAHAISVQTPSGTVPLISVPDLITMKRATHRDHDIRDIAELIRRHGPSIGRTTSPHASPTTAPPEQCPSRETQRPRQGPSTDHGCDL